MKPEETQIKLRFADDGVTIGVYVTALGDDLYQLREHPDIFIEAAKYGDIIRAVSIEPGLFEFKEVVQPSPFETYMSCMSLRLIESEALLKILDKVIDSGGFWQRDFGGWLSLFYLADVYNPCPEIAAIKLEGDVPDIETQIEEMKNWSERFSLMKPGVVSREVSFEQKL